MISPLTNSEYRDDFLTLQRRWTSQNTPGLLMVLGKYWSPAIEEIASLSFATTHCPGIRNPSIDGGTKGIHRARVPPVRNFVAS